MDFQSVALSTHFRFLDKTGKKFNQWTVVVYAGKRKNDHVWQCRCDCGTEAIVYGGLLVSGRSKSCGCCKSVAISKARRIHGHTHESGKRNATPEYNAWTRMKDRCYNPNAERYNRYGGRGIKVCNRWLHSFENFLTDVGFRPSRKHSLDRSEVNGNYEPGNVRWATAKEQSRNKERTVFVTWQGKRMPLVELIDDVLPKADRGFYCRILRKLKNGLSIENALVAASQD